MNYDTMTSRPFLWMHSSTYSHTHNANIHVYVYIYIYTYIHLSYYIDYYTITQLTCLQKRTLPHN